MQAIVEARREYMNMLEECMVPEMSNTFINMYDDTQCDVAQNNITAEDFKRHGAHIITYDNDRYTIIKTIE